VTNQSMLWRTPSLMLTKTHIIREMRSFMGDTMTNFDQGAGHIFWMMKHNLLIFICIWCVHQSLH
jgi:uncharacterized membrane protein